MNFILDDICTIMRPTICDGCLRLEDMGDYFCKISPLNKPNGMTHEARIFCGITGAVPGSPLVTSHHVYIILAVNDNSLGLYLLR